jgi:hypothetical protein
VVAFHPGSGTFLLTEGKSDASGYSCEGTLYASRRRLLYEGLGAASHEDVSARQFRTYCFSGPIESWLRLERVKALSKKELIAREFKIEVRREKRTRKGSNDPFQTYFLIVSRKDQRLIETRLEVVRTDDPKPPKVEIYWPATSPEAFVIVVSSFGDPSEGGYWIAKAHFFPAPSQTKRITTLAAFLKAELPELVPGKAADATRRGLRALRAGTRWEAAMQFANAAELEPARALPRVNLACVAALEGDRAGAITALRAALALDPGLTRARMRVERDFDSIRATREFKALLREKAARPEPGHGPSPKPRTE